MSAELFYLLMAAIYIAPDMSKRGRNNISIAFTVAAAVAFGMTIWRALA